MKTVRHPFDRVRTPTIILGDSKTHQSHAEACDINHIIRRFDRTGVLSPETRPAQFHDVTALQGDLTERINQSREVLDTAGRALQEHRDKVKQKREEQQIELESEIARLKAENEALVKRQSGTERTAGS